MKMSKAVSMSLALVLLCALAACSGGYDEASGRYTNKDEGISMQLPAGWDDSNTTFGVLITVNDKATTSQIDITSMKLPEGMDLESLVQRLITGYRQAGARFPDKGVMTIGGSDGLWEKMNLSVAGYQYTALLYHVRKGERVYTVLCNTLAENFAVNEEICSTVAESFRFDG